MPAILAQVGIGVSDLEASLEFYTTTLDIGLAQTQAFDTPDFDEIVLSFPARTVPSSSSSSTGADDGGKKRSKKEPALGSELALMKYKNGAKAPTSQQGKLMFFVDDVEEVMERCKQAAKRQGSRIKIDSDVGEGEGVLEYIGLVRDPDGFLVEFLPMMFLQAAQGGSKL